MQPIYTENDNGTVNFGETYYEIKAILDELLKEVITPSTRMPLRFVNSETKLARESDPNSLYGDSIEITYSIDKEIMYSSNYLVGMFDELIKLGAKYVEQTNAYLVLDRQLENIIVPVVNSLPSLRKIEGYCTLTLFIDVKENLDIVPKVVVNLYQSSEV